MMVMRQVSQSTTVGGAKIVKFNPQADSNDRLY